MIESDINEQMASFSPTQNANAGIDRDVDAIAADMASKRQLLPDPMLPKENAVPDIDQDAAAIAARRNNELMASMMAASQTNPVEAAKALKLGEKFGVGTDMALRNQADLERMDLMNSVQRRDLMQRDPVLARYLTQRDFAAIAHDDIDNLSATESIFNYVRRIPSRIETGLIQAVDTAERGEIYTRQRAGKFHESDKIVLDAIKTELANLPQDNGFIESAAQFMGIRAEMAPTMFRRAAFGTVAGAAMGGPAGAAIGMGIGLDVGSFEVGAEMEGGNAYGDMKEAGYNDSIAVPASVGVGVINGALELVGGKILTAGYRYAFKSAVSTATREALVRPTTVAALKTLGMGYAKGIAGETATEVSQEIVTIAGDEIARYYGSNLESRLASPEGRKEIADRLVDTALQTAMGMAVIGAGGPAAQFYVDQSRANAANRAQSFFENLNKNVVNSEVRGRNVDAYERFIASQAEGTGAETIYVDAREMANVLRQSALTDQEMDNVLPGLRQQLEQAMSVGGDVTIPTAGFAARVAGTDLGDKMMPHMRLDPSAMSAQQAEQYATQLEQRKAEALAIVAEKETTDSTFVDEARAIEKEALTQLEAAGQDKKLAKLNAQIYRDMVVVMAANVNRNQTPAQVHAEIGPDIFGPQGMQVAPGATAAPTPVSAVPAVENLPRPPKPEGMEQEFYDALIARAIKNVGNAGTVDLTFGVRPEGSETDMPLRVEANLRAAGNNEAADVYIEMARRVADRNIAAFQERRAAEAAAPLEQADQFDKDGQRRTDTPKFKAWFKESKAVTEQGAPLRLYRGAPEKITEPRRMFSGGIFLTPSRELALSYGPEIMEVFASVQKPLDVSDAKTMSMKQWRTYLQRKGVDMQTVRFDSSLGTRYSDPGVDSLAGGADSLGGVIRYNFYELLGENDSWKNDGNLREELQRQGFDGVISQPETGAYVEGRQPVWIVWEGNQLKSPDNRGTWSRTTSHIFEQAAATPAFFSALEREVTAIDAKALTAAGWGERLTGLVNKGAIKADELEWSGLSDYLKMQEGKVSKDTVLEFLRGNGVRVEQVDLRSTKYGKYTLPGGQNYREVLLTLPAGIQAPAPAMSSEGLAARGAIFDKYAPRLAELEREMNSLMFAGRALTDEEAQRMADVGNERDELEDQRNAEARAAYEIPERADSPEFTTSHWSQRNVLVHLRMNDRVDADGKRVLFVEEVQSDWGQAGVKRGFVNQRAADEAELADLSTQQEANPTDARKKQIARIQERLTKDEYNIARAPYVETTDGWLNLGLKQIMLEAVRGGYDRVAFVNGQQSADRYDLSKRVSRIEWSETHNYLSAFDEEGEEVISRLVTRDELPDVIGKEVADKLLASQVYNRTPYSQTVDRAYGIESGNMKVGGKGMQNFYDKIVPAAMGKLLKKYGGEKLGQVGITEQGTMRNLSVHSDGTQYWLEFNDGTRASGNVASYLEADSIREQLESGISKQPGFDITPELVKKLESGLPLFQAVPERGPPRGQYDANRIAILLNTKASATTFFHELIHWRMDMAIRMVNQGKASAQEAADVDTLFKSFGIAGDTPQERLATWNKMSIEQQRPHWEAVAYNSEIYLFEGKAPSVEMQGVFDRLHAFVKRVYVSIKTELNDLYRQEFGKDLPILTGEVREVMDRWLASEEQIQRKQAMMQMVPLYLTQEESGMDDATWAQHQQANKEAEEAAVTDLTKASLRQMEWLSGARSRILKKLQSMHDDLRKKTRAEVMEEVKNEPVYAAMSILKTGEGRAKNGELVKFNDKFKLNLEMVKKMLPEEQVRQLGYGKYGMVAADGISPDMVAEMVGFSSGDELVLAILAAKPIKEEVDARTDRRMMEEHGELNTPQAMEEAVQRALHNEARARFNAVYVRFLSKSTAPVQAFMDAAKLAARQIISGKVIRDLRPGDHQAAEAKAARDAAEAHKSRRTAEQAAKAAETKERNVGLSAAAAGVPMTEVEAAAAAKGQEAAQRVAEREAEYKAKYGDRTPEQVMLRAKQIQLLQNQLAREAQEAKDEVAKAVKDFRKFFKADDKLAKTRNMDLVDAARAILSAFGFGKSDKSPAEYIDKLKAYNPEMYAAIEPLVMAATSGSKNYKDLTVEQFRQLREVVDALWEQSRRDKLVEIDGKMVALSDVVGELETRLDEIGVPEVVAGERGAPTTKDRAVRGFYDAKAAMRRVEHWADATDGPKGVGPFTKYIWRPIKDAINAYRIDRNKYVKKYVELLKQVVLPEGKIESKELDYTFGNANGGIGKAELLGALMHTGNDSNKKKLLVGRGWGSINEDGTLDSSRWDAFVARMIKQGVLTKSDFDFVQATWDLLEEVKPIAQKAHRSIFGFYFKEVEATPFTNEFGTFRGGYVPAKTDAFIVRDAQRQSKMEELESDFRNSMPSTGMGFTKGRVEYNKPLSMDVRLVTKHIDDVLRFAHVQPAIKDVLRILKNRGFSDKLSRIDPTVVEEMLIPWLNRAARQVTSEPGRNKGMDKFWKAVRSRTGISIMTANLRNALQQFTGLFPSALKVSKTQLGNALLTYMGSPLKTANEVASLSTFMNERLQSQIFDMQDDINEILLNPNAYNKVVKWTQKHSYFLQSAFQNMVDVVTWTAKYNQVLAESKVGASDTKVQREAIQQADAAVRLTQGSMSAEDISAYEVGTPFYKTFNQFGGYFNMLANLNADEYIKVIRDLGWRGNKGKLLNIYILGFVAPTLVADAIARSMGGGWDDDDDGYLDDVMDWFFGSQARAAAAMIPFGSAAATAIITAFDSKAYNDRISASPSITALEASTIGVGKTIINIADDDKEVEGKNVRDVMTLISLATGTPVTVLGRPVGYLVDVNRKKIKPTGPIDVARGLVTGVAGGESKKK